MKNPMPNPYPMVNASGIKSIVATLVVAGWLAIAPAQAQINDISQVDERIVAAYGTDHVNRLIAESPHYLEYLDFYLDNAFYLYPHPNKPGGGLAYVSDVVKNTDGTPAAQILPPDPNNLAAFNALQYHFKRDRTQRMVYMIDGTDQALYFYSDTELSKAYNEFKANKQ